jgi:hypothetical protein
MEKIKLPNVTLIALTGINIEGHQKALEYSQRGIEFGAVKLIYSPSENIDEWCRKIVYDLGDYVDTEFALLIHDDGFVIHPEMWDADWLNYDFIGAPFPLPKDNFSYRDINGKIQRVGHSVSLRSKKLLDLPKKIGMEWKPFHGFYNEDGYISVNMRHIFEENGCKFAPFEIALHFGREAVLPENKNIRPFVFHKNAGPNKKYPNFEKKKSFFKKILGMIKKYL